MNKVLVLQVLLHQKVIGSLTLLPGEQCLFSFNPEYIQEPSRPVLSLSFKKELGGLVTQSRPTRVRLPPFFSNLLPEGPLRDYLAKQAGIKATREFFLLMLLGQDLPGAVQVQGEDNKDLLRTSLFEGENQSKLAKKSLLRFSLAGVQLKFSAVLKSRGGLTIPAHGVGGSWIVKLPSLQFEGVVENEFSMMKLAQAVGILVPELKLVKLEKIVGLPKEMKRLKSQALAIKRFDRGKGGKKIHLEDFAQVFGLYPEEKYSRANYLNIAQVIWEEVGQEGIQAFIKRFVFNALIGNADMHLKNWSLIYEDGRQASLAPAYDFVSTVAYPVSDQLALNFLKSKAFEDLSLQQLERFAAKARLPKKLVIDTLKETVRDFREVWKKEASHLLINKDSVRAINQHLKRLPLAKI